jgi:hypothetical protein
MCCLVLNVVNTGVEDPEQSCCVCSTDSHVACTYNRLLHLYVTGLHSISCT